MNREDKFAWVGNMTHKIALVSFPHPSQVPYKFLSDILKILDPISSKVILIDGNTNRIKVAPGVSELRDIGLAMHFSRDVKPWLFSAILWIFKCFFIQIKISLELIKANQNYDIVIFYLAYDHYLIPLITSKLLGKRAIEVVTRSKPHSMIAKILSLQDYILFRLLDGISLESNILLKELNLDRYNHKLLESGARFINTTTYCPKIEFSRRDNIIGYISRLKKEKGVIQFVKAIPLVAAKNKDVEFLIGGDGDLLKFIRDECDIIRKKNKIKITITGYIDEKEFPEYLNKLKLLVLPTEHSEGLPTIILEAMSCGTPVLATSIGGIPDIIIDGKSGFIMDDNSYKCIAENIIRAIEYKNIDEIIGNATSLIKNNYSYGAAVSRYDKILSKIAED